MKVICSQKAGVKFLYYGIQINLNVINNQKGTYFTSRLVGALGIFTNFILVSNSEHLNKF